MKGRFFDARDTADAPGVVIVNEVLARRQWRGEEPLGQSLISPIRVIGPLGRSLMKQTVFQVIGVVASVKNAALVRDAEPAVYFTYRQFPFRGMNIVVQGRGGSAALMTAVKTRSSSSIRTCRSRRRERSIGSWRTRRIDRAR